MGGSVEHWEVVSGNNRQDYWNRCRRRIQRQQRKMGHIEKDQRSRSDDSVYLMLIGQSSDIILTMIINRILRVCLNTALQPKVHKYTNSLSLTSFCTLKSEKVTPTDCLNNIDSIISHSTNISELVSISQTIFTQHSNLIPQLAYKITPLVKRPLSNQLNGMLSQIDQSSVSSTLPASALFTILTLYHRILTHSDQPPWTHRKEFLKKTETVVATHIANKTFSLPQATLSVQMLIDMGAGSLLVFGNLLKMLKTHYKLGVVGQSQISLIQLLTLLELRRINSIVLEQVLYDLVLHHLLINMKELLSTANEDEKWEVLLTLLRVDLGHCYRSDSSLWRIWVSSLLDEAVSKVKQQWADKWLKREKGTDRKIILLLDTIDQVRRRHKQDDHCWARCQQILNCVVEQMKESIGWYMRQNWKQLLPSQLNLLVSVLFNPTVFKKWIKCAPALYRSVSKNLPALILSSAHVRTIANVWLLWLRYENDRDVKEKYLGMCKQIQKNSFKKGRIVWQLSQILLNECPQERSRINQQIKGHSKTAASIQESLSAWWVIGGDLSAQIQSAQKSKQSLISLIDSIFKSVTSFGTFDTMAHKLGILWNDLPQLGQMIQKKAVGRLSTHHLQLMTMLLAHVINTNTPFSQLPPSVKQTLEYLLQNDSLKHPFLLNCYLKQSSTLDPCFLSNFDTFGKAFKLLESLLSQRKYDYFLWDLFINNYVQLPQPYRQQHFPLLQSTFIRALKTQKQKAHMLMHLTSVMAGGLVPAPRLKLQSLFETSVEIILDAEADTKFPYQCFAHLVQSALSADILSPIYFDSIVKYSLKRDPSLKGSCGLLLLYGAHLSNRNTAGGVIHGRVITEQRSYLQHIITSKLLQIRSIDNDSIPKNVVYLTGRQIAILFEFGEEKLVQLHDQVKEYISKCHDFAEWSLIANAYSPQNYSLRDTATRQFRIMVNQCLIDGLIHFKEVGRLSKEQEKYFIEKLK